MKAFVTIITLLSFLNQNLWASTQPNAIQKAAQELQTELLVNGKIKNQEQTDQVIREFAQRTAEFMIESNATAEQAWNELASILRDKNQLAILSATLESVKLQGGAATPEQLGSALAEALMQSSAKGSNWGVSRDNREALWAWGLMIGWGALLVTAVAALTIIEPFDYCNPYESSNCGESKAEYDQEKIKYDAGVVKAKKNRELEYISGATAGALALVLMNIPEAPPKRDK